MSIYPTTWSVLLSYMADECVVRTYWDIGGLTVLTFDCPAARCYMCLEYLAMYCDGSVKIGCCGVPFFGALNVSQLGCYVRVGGRFVVRVTPKLDVAVFLSRVPFFCVVMFSTHSQ